jgi:hypothetical protein
VKEGASYLGIAFQRYEIYGSDQQILEPSRRPCANGRSAKSHQEKPKILPDELFAFRTPDPFSQIADLGAERGCGSLVESVWT